MYDSEIIGGFTVHVEENMDKYHSTWRETLTRDIERVTDALPTKALNLISDARIYLHKKYIYPGDQDSKGAAVSENLTFIIRVGPKSYSINNNLCKKYGLVLVEIH
jgi:hypothetical protein